MVANNISTAHRDIEVAINEQVLPTLIRGNFPPAKQEDAYIKFDSIDWNRKIALKEIFLEQMRTNDNFAQVGIKPRFMPSTERLAEILNIPLDTWDEAVDDSEMDTGASEEGTEPTPDNVTKLPTKTAPGGKAVPKRATRTSSSGSRAVDGKDLRPGGKRAEQIRAKLNDPLPEIAAAGPGYYEGYYPTMSAPLSEHLRVELTRMCTTDDGMLSVKSGLLRLKVWAGSDMISQFELMGTDDLVRAISTLQDFQIMILYEAITKRLSDEDSNEFQKALAAAYGPGGGSTNKSKKKKKEA